MTDHKSGLPPYDGYYNESSEGLPRTVNTRAAGTIDLARYWTLSCENDPITDAGQTRERLMIKALAEYHDVLTAVWTAYTHKTCLGCQKCSDAHHVINTNLDNLRALNG